MSVYRCLTSVIRRRSSLEKLVSPIVPILCKISHENDCITEKYGIIPEVSVRRYGRPPQRNKSSSSSSDSDAEKGTKKGRKGQSQFWRQKMRTHHMAIDLNNDGVVSWEDFEVLIKNFAALGNLSQSELQHLSDALLHVWEEEWGASGDPYAFIGFEQFLKTMEHVVNTKELRKKVASPLQFIFNAVDWDSSGEISIEEFKTFYKCLNLSEEAAVEAFSAIDENSDGKLSKAEFIHLGRDFFTSEDENNPSKLFWGPLAK